MTKTKIKASICIEWIIKIERNALWNILCKFGCTRYKENNQLITIIIAVESTNPTNKEINNKQTNSHYHSK